MIAKFIITGRVQGVFFRASTRAQARNLDVAGYARNLPDGSVEVLASGDAGALETLEQWLRHGPPQARVDRVARTEVEAAGADIGTQFRTL